MKRLLFRASFALFAAFAVVSVSSCGGDDDDDASVAGSDTPATADDETLTPAGRAAVAVDLGLPSGLKWADRNVGASKAEDRGDYFAWGEVSFKSSYSWSNYAYGSSENELTKYCHYPSYGKGGYTDVSNPEIGKVLTVLQPSDDAAHANWGGQWRMPTKAEFQELIDNTNHSWVTNYNGTGKSGRKFVSKTDASKYIFFPASGYYVEASLYAPECGEYWASTYHSTKPYAGDYLWINATNASAISNENSYRYEGCPVRAVKP